MFVRFILLIIVNPHFPDALPNRIFEVAESKALDAGVEVKLHKKKRNPTERVPLLYIIKIKVLRCLQLVVHVDRFLLKTQLFDLLQVI